MAVFGDARVSEDEGAVMVAVEPLAEDRAAVGDIGADENLAVVDTLEDGCRSEAVALGEGNAGGR